MCTKMLLGSLKWFLSNIGLFRKNNHLFKETSFETSVMDETMEEILKDVERQDTVKISKENPLVDFSKSTSGFREC